MPIAYTLDTDLYLSAFLKYGTVSLCRHNHVYTVGYE